MPRPSAEGQPHRRASAPIHHIHSLSPVEGRALRVCMELCTVTTADHRKGKRRDQGSLGWADFQFG